MNNPFGIPHPSQTPAPAGYRKALWNEVSPGDEVYLLVLDARKLECGHRVELSPKAHGPYRIGPAGYPWLLSGPDRAGETHAVQEPGERLLVKVKMKE